jgi:hypothetical protein
LNSKMHEISGMKKPVITTDFNFCRDDPLHPMQVPAIGGATSK